MSAPTREAQEVLDKLRAITEQIEGYRATLAMLEHERFKLEAEQHATGYRPDPQAPLL